MNNQDRQDVLNGKCLVCFYLMFKNDGEAFICAKFDFLPKGAVADCPGFKPVAEGLTELVSLMKARGELPERIDDNEL
jgi:hypothetical protein